MAGADPQALDPRHATDERPAIGAQGTGALAKPARRGLPDLGHESRTSGDEGRHERCGLGLVVEKGRAQRARPVRRDEAERKAWVVRDDLGTGLDPGFGLFEDMVRRPLELDRRDDAPQRPDRAPAAGRVDERGRPWACRDDDRRRIDAPAVVEDHADGRVPLDPWARGGPDLELDAAALGQAGVGLRRRERADRVADVETAGRNPRSEGRFEGGRFAGRQVGRVQLRVGTLEFFGQAGGLARVVGHVQEPGRAVGQVEAVVREGAIEPERGQVQLHEDRVERVLDDPRVATGRARADRVTLDEDHPPAGLRQVRRGRDADDAAAEDDDVGRVVRWARVHAAIMAPARRSVGLVSTAEPRPPGGMTNAPAEAEA
jgi:hypothetical protein